MAEMGVGMGDVPAEKRSVAQDAGRADAREPV